VSHGRRLVRQFQEAGQGLSSDVLDLSTRRRCDMVTAFFIGDLGCCRHGVPWSSVGAFDPRSWLRAFLGCVMLVHPTSL